MGLRQSLKQLFTKSANGSSTQIDLRNPSPEARELFSLLGNDYKFGTQNEDFLLNAYGANPYVFMVIDRISQRLVEIDKTLLDRNDQAIENPEFLELFKNPNNKENGDQLLYRAAATYLTAGECFLVRRQALGEEDRYEVPINWNVRINENTEGHVISYWVTSFSKTETFLPGDVLHIKKPDITHDTNHGFSTLRATRKVWESNNEVWSSEAALHKNKGITGVLYSDGNRPMTDTEQKQLQEKYDVDNTGATNFGKVKISTSKLGYVQMGMNPNDLKSIETRLEHLRTTCASFNVDSKLFGDPAATTYNNMAEAQRAFIVNAVLPLSRVLLPQIIKFMSRSVFASYSMQLDEDTILELQLTKEQRSARLGREVIQGILPAEKAFAMLYPELVEELEEGEAPPTTEANTPTLDELLRLQQGINQETITRENAAAMLSAVYGFDEMTANEILG